MNVSAGRPRCRFKGLKFVEDSNKLSADQRKWQERIGFMCKRDHMIIVASLYRQGHEEVLKLVQRAEDDDSKARKDSVYLSCWSDYNYSSTAAAIA